MTTLINVPAFKGCNRYVLNRQQLKNLTVPSFWSNPQNNQKLQATVATDASFFFFLLLLQSLATVIIFTVRFIIVFHLWPFLYNNRFFSLIHNKAFANVIMHES